MEDVAVLEISQQLVGAQWKLWAKESTLSLS